jgi:hypothetical protein
VTAADPRYVAARRVPQPYTSDGDLALDPILLGDDPQLEAAMRDAGFKLSEPRPGTPEPGIWVATATVAGEELISTPPRARSVTSRSSSVAATERA